MKYCEPAELPNFGVIEAQLEQEDIDYLWKIVHKYSHDAEWEGNRLISIEEDYKQFPINDDENLFQNNVLKPCTEKYFETYGCPFKLKTTHSHELAFSRFWCRASLDGDYQSIHDHQGIFTFVVWLTVPFEGKDERQVQAGFRPEASDFVLVYPDTCGQLQKRNFVLGKGAEGKMLFFPSDINHIVYPHYTTKEYRIALAGDVALNSMALGSPINPVEDKKRIL